MPITTTSVSTVSYTHLDVYKRQVPILEETAQKNGIPFKAVKIESRKDAQNVPTPITTYALFCDGEYVTNEQMNDKKFLKLVSR